MKNKLFITAVAIAAITIGSASAQYGPGGQQRDCEETSKMRTEMLKKEVGLNEKQEKAAKAIYLKNCEEIQKIRESGDREAFRSLREKGDKEINALLTPEQQEKWKKAQERAAAERERNGGQGRRP